MISVLCIDEKSNYRKFTELDLWDKNRDAYNFKGINPVITHAPCHQWSRLKRFAVNDKKEKELAFFCLEKVKSNGGIFEHPSGSSFFREAGIKPTLNVELTWFGYPARKRTWLYFHGFKPASFPISFDLATKKIEYMNKKERSITPVPMIEFFINSLK